MNKVLHLSEESIFDLLYGVLARVFAVPEQTDVDYESASYELEFHYNNNAFSVCTDPDNCDHPGDLVVGFAMSMRKGVLIIDRIESVDIHAYQIGVDELHTHFLPVHQQTAPDQPIASDQTSSDEHKGANGAISQEYHKKLMSLADNEREVHIGVFITLNEEYLAPNRKNGRKMKIFADFARIYEYSNSPGLCDIIVQYANSITISPCRDKCFDGQPERFKEFLEYKKRMKERVDQLSQLEDVLTSEEYYREQLFLLGAVKGLPKCLNSANHTDIRAKHFIKYGECNKFAGISSTRAYELLEKAECVFGMSYLLLRSRAAFNLSSFQ